MFLFPPDKIAQEPRPFEILSIEDRGSFFLTRFSSLFSLFFSFHFFSFRVDYFTRDGWWKESVPRSVQTKWCKLTLELILRFRLNVRFSYFFFFCYFIFMFYFVRKKNLRAFSDNRDQLHDFVIVCSIIKYNWTAYCSSSRFVNWSD